MKQIYSCAGALNGLWSTLRYAQPNINGNTHSENIMAQSIPPITTRASGLELSEPIVGSPIFRAN